MGGLRDDVVCYFRCLASRISAECRSVRQSSFVMVRKHKFVRSFECISLSVVTINQFWKYSEHFISKMVLDRDSRAEINRLMQNAAKAARKEIYSRSAGTGDSIDELEDIFLSAEVWKAEASQYAQSHLPFDLLFRHHDPEEEERIRQSGVIQSFEYSGASNLISLMREKEKNRLEQIVFLVTFGDSADF